MAEIDKEKVIKGLHCCSRTDGANCIYCPYDNRDTDCTALMSMDVLELLKEQEEQIKTRDESLEKAREEIKWLRGMLKEQEPKLLKPEEFAGSLDYVWVETRVSDNRSGLFVADICLASDAINYELQMCGQSDRPILEHSQLGKRWRCWDKKPTEAQMRAVKWNV